MSRPRDKIARRGLLERASSNVLIRLRITCELAVPASSTPSRDDPARNNVALEHLIREQHYPRLARKPSGRKTDVTRANSAALSRTLDAALERITAGTFPAAEDRIARPRRRREPRDRQKGKVYRCEYTRARTRGLRLYTRKLVTAARRS